MTDAGALTNDIRQAAAELVRREEYRTGSRMVAYENVAQMVGGSSSWLRKFVRGYADVALSFPAGMNIVALYSQLCERVEARALNLEEANAASARALKAVAGKVRATSSAPDVESSRR